MRPRLVLLCCFFLLLMAVSAPYVYAASQKEAYSRLVEACRKKLAAEEEDFARLHFKLAPKEMQMRKVENLMGVSHKFILKDNKGRYWIFKPSSEEVKALCMYKIFSLCGLDTPQVCWAHLKINGEITEGSMQRFIIDAKTARGVRPSQLNKDCLDYLLRTHVLQWLFANYDASARHFLVLYESGKVEKLMRIDNTNCLHLLGQDKLDFRFCPPYLDSYKAFYYYRMWDDFINHGVSLDIKQNLIFIRFLEGIPDEAVMDLISPALQYELTNRADITLRDRIAERKKNLSRDFISFYKEIMDMRGEKLALPGKQETDRGVREIIAACVKSLEKHNLPDNREKYDTPFVSRETDSNTDIKVVASVKGWKIIARIIWTYSIYNTKVPPGEYRTALSDLRHLRSECRIDYERKALDYYIREVKKVLSGKKDITEIQRIIESP